MHRFTSIDNNRVAIDLRTVEAVMERNNGIQLVTRSDTYMVRGDFLEVVALVDKVQEGKA